MSIGYKVLHSLDNWKKKLVVWHYVALLVYRIETVFFSNIEKKKLHISLSIVFVLLDTVFFTLSYHIFIGYLFLFICWKVDKKHNLFFDPPKYLHQNWTKIKQQMLLWCYDLLNWTCDFRTFQLAVKTNLDDRTWFISEGMEVWMCKSSSYCNIQPL